MKKILVPTDFSPEAVNALAYAVAMAKETDAEICLLHAFSIAIPLSAGDMPQMYVSPNEIQEGIEKRLELEALRSRKEMVKVSIKALAGDAAPTIEEEIATWEPDIVVMGIAHAGKWYGKIIGSTVTKLNDHLTCPLLIIPAEASYAKIKKIVLATDRSERANKHWNALKDLIDLNHAELMLLKILPDEEMEGSHLLAQDPEQHLYILGAHDIVNGIHDFIAQQNVQLLAMIPYKHTIWEQVTSFSNTEQMVFQIKIPLLLLP